MWTSKKPPQNDDFYRFLFRALFLYELVILSRALRLTLWSRASILPGFLELAISNCFALGIGVLLMGNLTCKQRKRINNEPVSNSPLRRMVWQ